MIRYGLDFGTTNSSISLPEVGGARLLPIDSKALDPKVIRSLLYFFHRDIEVKKDKKGKEQWEYVGDFRYTFGQEAMESYLKDNTNRKPGITKQIFTGRMVQINASPNAGPADLVAEYYEEIDYGTGRLLQALKTALKSPVYKGTNIFGKFFTLEQMIGIFVSLIKNRADEIIGEKGVSLRVGRPVHFLDDPKKDLEVQKRLEESLTMVGFEKIEFEFEPVAAAKYYLSRFPGQHKLIFVFDFGGGTLDTAIMRFDNGYKVLATDGVYIGGNLLNSDIMREKLSDYFGANLHWGEMQIKLPGHIMDSLNSWYSIPNLNNPSDMRFLEQARYKNTDLPALERLIYLIRMNLGFEIYEAIENAKKELSANSETYITFKDGPIDIKTKITRAEFEDLIRPRIDRIRQTVLETLQSAKVDPREIDVVVRTGGSSLIPMVERMLAEIFGKEKIQLFDIFTSIVAGLAID